MLLVFQSAKKRVSSQVGYLGAVKGLSMACCAGTQRGREHLGGLVGEGTVDDSPPLPSPSSPLPNPRAPAVVPSSHFSRRLGTAVGCRRHRPSQRLGALGPSRSGCPAAGGQTLPDGRPPVVFARTRPATPLSRPSSSGISKGPVAWPRSAKGAANVRDACLRPPPPPPSPCRSLELGLPLLRPASPGVPGWQLDTQMGPGPCGARAC